MSGPPRNYSALSAEEQAAVSVWIDAFDQSYAYEGTAALKKAVQAAPEELRSALVSQLLPSLIDHDRKRHGRTPTLHELRSRFPDLAGVLNDAYPLLPAEYRLPVQLRGYRVLRVAGEGGQAIVLRAQDDMHSAVAIKLSVSPEHNEWLLRERELLGQCQHPGIPEVIASGVDEDRAFFVMPFLRGMTLADKYATHRPSAEEATRIAEKLCEVVDHLHSRGILHRDIKPQNVWLDESGGVKLIDLGMAIDRSRWGTPRAAVDEFHGTPAFMSPEQAASNGEQDGELSDVFSIGAVLYWMGTGRAPYGEGSEESVLSQASSGRFDRKRLQAVSDWGRSLPTACLKAMSLDPSQRYHSASAFRDAIAASQSKQKKPGLKIAAILVLAVGTALAGGATSVELRRYANALLTAVTLVQPSEPVADESPSVSPSPPSEEPAEPPISSKPPTEPSLPEQHRDPSEGNEANPKALTPLVIVKPVESGPYRPPVGASDPPATKKLEDYSAPYLPDPPDLKPTLGVEQKVKIARNWLASLKPGTTMGHFAGIRFNPTALAPISPALKSIKIPHRVRRTKGGALVDGVISFTSVNRLANTPKWVYQGLERSLTRDDRTEYALDNLVAPVPSPQEWVIRVPPGLQGVSFYGEFLDGSLTDRYYVENEDYTLATQVFPVDTHQGKAPEAYLFLYRERGVTLRESLAKYLPKPIDDEAPFRERFERTAVGFYAAPHGWAGTVVASNEPVTKFLAPAFKPGVIHVAFVSYDNKVVGRVAYDVPIERFEELADAAMLYSERFHSDPPRSAPHR